MYGYLALYNLGVLISWAKNVYQKLYCKCKSHLYNCELSKGLVRLGNILTPKQQFCVLSSPLGSENDADFFCGCWINVNQ